METWRMCKQSRLFPVSMCKAYIEAVSKLKSLLATGRWSKKSLPPLAKDSSNEEIH